MTRPAPVLTGGCLCGAVRYRIEAAPLVTLICHCATCRRAAGAQSVAWGTFPGAAFAWTAAAPARHASSPGVARAHCAACGASLTWQGEPHTIDVTLASLDDPEAAPPVCETWLSHRLSWAPTDPSLPAFAEGVPSPIDP
ncbi:GFA family protein [Amaricoccus sp.]|uniref:GFA family protein n=1 Tax=Amaricoccus sp. TaxID=1872485 RepID=UPI001B6951F8|nr:GFA family protein [Amaricoccus sp.]MBP7001934.1 GFA family protein [Amaricoccus sp.]